VSLPQDGQRRHCAGDPAATVARLRREKPAIDPVVAIFEGAREACLHLRSRRRGRSVGNRQFRGTGRPVRVLCCALLELAMMTPLTSLIDVLYQEEVARARTQDPGDKLLEGARLFERACRLMADGIRHRHPGLSDAEVLARVEAQLARLRTLDTP